MFIEHYELTFIILETSIINIAVTITSFIIYYYATTHQLKKQPKQKQQKQTQPQQKDEQPQTEQQNNEPQKIKITYHP